ncbi:hypothetical protein E1281_08515 [Actinomadura sp. KC345]|uniref:hypothetical protein n=1 Tax=Actinomadura sp. KC345 TaxID=2530371 RepID=UPI001049E9F7|nr:hypothetical protein [Actinomadura sp. KC345]TDC56223.1 hypothetical protein E1281_08515 [Actinomadura sp. KC345]
MDTEDLEPVRPFRWNLVRRQQLGSLLDGAPEPDLWFLDELVACAAKVLARCADGEVYFVGRSPDSLFDLLSGALADTSWQGRLHQLPFSLRWGAEDLSGPSVAQLRANLAAAGLSPHRLARGERPLVFTDLVAKGGTFESLYTLLRDWIDDERAQWDVIRRKVRFLGITWRTKTSPNTWRWQQKSEWTGDLPRKSIVNISLHGAVWSYLGNDQKKLTVSFNEQRWSADSVTRPRHDEDTRRALAEAVALVEAGRTREVRNGLVRHITEEPAVAERWVRALVSELSR